MSLFTEATITQAYLKAGFFGLNGTGKTRTATEIAIGLTLHLKKLGIPEGTRPIFFIDTETGSDYVKHLVTGAGIGFKTAKTRAFKDLVPAVREAEQGGSVLIIDSITHFWREFTDSYKARKQRTHLTMQDWGYLKSEWAKFTDAYVNSSAHIILCGRAGFEYDNYTDEDGKKQMEKTGVKMKAEGEMGYEPSLLVYMEREEDIATHQVIRVGYVLKDRFDVIDGKALTNKEHGGPTFADFLPHIQLINLGGKHLGVDTSRTSEDMHPESGKADWQYRKEQVDITMDEIQTLLVKHVPGQGAEDKRRKVLLLEKHLGSGSWERIKTFKLEDLRRGFEALKAELEPPPAETENGVTPDNSLSQEQVQQIYAEERAKQAAASAS